MPNLIKTYTQEQIRVMSLEEAKDNLYDAVYIATSLLERLENAGKCRGNGHHARQKLARIAVEELETRWRDKEPS